MFWLLCNQNVKAEINWVPNWQAAETLLNSPCFQYFWNCTILVVFSCFCFSYETDAAMWMDKYYTSQGHFVSCFYKVLVPYRSLHSPHFLGWYSCSFHQDFKCGKLNHWVGLFVLKKLTDVKFTFVPMSCYRCVCVCVFSHSDVCESLWSHEL